VFTALTLLVSLATVVDAFWGTVLDVPNLRASIELAMFSVLLTVTVLADGFRLERDRNNIKLRSKLILATWIIGLTMMVAVGTYFGKCCDFAGVVE
jgi:hypothetical protein